MTAAVIDRSFNAKHTFVCALSTRGGVCDCWPEQVGSIGSDASGYGYLAGMTDAIEHCAVCGETLNGLAHEIVDLAGVDQLCERCFLHAEHTQLADADAAATDFGAGR